MTAFEAYQIYRALLLHFDTESDYDFFKYGKKKVRIDPKTFQKRSDRFRFEKLAKTFTYKELIYFVVANIVEENKPTWVGTMLSQDADDLYFRWRKRIESLSYVFSEEMDKILVDTEFTELFKTPRNSLPKILRLYFQKEISLETLILLDKCCRFLPRYEKELRTNPVCSDLVIFIKKYTPFLQYDLNKIGHILKEKVIVGTGRVHVEADG